MLRNLTQALTVSLLLALTGASAALAQDRIDIAIERGTIAPTGDRASLDITVGNATAATLRVVGLRAEYDTDSGDTLPFDSTPDLDFEVPPGDSVAHTVSTTTEYAEGTYVDWPNPYVLSAAVGVDIEALRARVESTDRADAVGSLLADVNTLTAQVRRANERFPERVASLPDAAAWFDTAAVEGLRDPLEQQLCRVLGRTVTSAGGSDRRVEAYRAAISQLTALNLYADCMGSDVRLAAARALVSSGSAQDTLVLTERDDEGNVLPEWVPIYVAGRLALARIALDGQQYGQFRPGLESLGEVRRLDPENRELGPLADELLTKAARHVNELIAEQNELDGLQMIELMRQDFADHSAVERASLALMQALVPYAQRSLEGGHPIRANNAYVRGLNLFGSLSAWEEVGGRIQALRRDAELAAAHTALAEGRLDEAEERLGDAEQRAPLEPAVYDALVDQILIARWAQLDELVAAGEFEQALARADELESGTERPEVLGEARDALYLSVAEAVWERYGMLAGIASRTRLGLAEEALAKGRAANPERADSLATQFLLARWIFPAAIGLVVVLVFAIVLLRGRWRRRRKARRLWRGGVARAQRGDLGKAAKLMGEAWEILETETNVAPLVGEETRGHLVLRIAAVQAERGRKDRVEEMRGEWQLLSEFERPYDQDFDTALERLRG